MTYLLSYGDVNNQCVMIRLSSNNFSSLAFGTSLFGPSIVTIAATEQNFDE